MKTAGIVADNYKVEEFKKELTKNGFNEFKIFPYLEGYSTIKVSCLESQYKEIEVICKRVELHFKRSN
jgi:hypothetical protein